MSHQLTFADSEFSTKRRQSGKNSLNRLIRCVCGKKIGPDPRNFNQRVSLGRNDLLIRTFPSRLPMLARQLTCTPGLFRCRFFLFSALVYGSTFATSPFHRMRFMCK